MADVDMEFLHAEFRGWAAHNRKALKHVVPDGYVPTLGKHEAQNWEGVRRAFEKAQTECPDAAAVIAWGIWHDIVCWDRLAAITAPDDTAAED